MKTTLILTVITILSLGALALVRAQDEETKPVEETAPAPETEVAEIPGIRTDIAVEQKLLGGTEETVIIPVASVFAEGDRFFVLARGVEVGDDFRETEVTLGKTDGMNVEVTEGVFPGDEVVTVSVNQLRFPAFDDGSGEFCGVGGCGPKTCDPATGVCSIKCEDGTACKTGETCEEGKACPVDATSGKACEPGKACPVNANFAPDSDLTIDADQFFNGAMEVIFEPAPFVGRPPMFPPY